MHARIGGPARAGVRRPRLVSGSNVVAVPEDDEDDDGAVLDAAAHAQTDAPLDRQSLSRALRSAASPLSPSRATASAVGRASSAVRHTLIRARPTGRYGVDLALDNAIKTVSISHPAMLSVPADFERLVAA